MSEDGKPLETLLEDAARARRLTFVLDGDPAALELERYAEEVEAEIHRRAAGSPWQVAQSRWLGHQPLPAKPPFAR